IVVNRQHQDKKTGMTVLQDPDTLDAAHAGETDVVEDDIREIAGDALEGFLHRTVGAGTAKSWRAVDDQGEAVADFPAVFHDRHANRCVAYGAHFMSGSLRRRMPGGQSSREELDPE